MLTWARFLDHTGSPWLLTIVPAVPDLDNSYAIGPGVVSGHAGIETNISVVTVDYWTNECIEGGDEVRALIRGPRYPPEITAVDLGTGVYVIYYTLDLVGQYNVIMHLNEYRFGIKTICISSSRCAAITTSSTAADIKSLALLTAGSG